MNTTTPRQTLHIALLLLLLPLSAHALTPAEVFERVKDSIVVVKTLDAQGEQKIQGSGVLLPNGKIATNCHVVKDGVRFQVGSGKQWVPATLYAGDSDKDICLLDAKDVGGTAAQLGKASNLKVGAPVYAVGAPQGLELSLSDGIVSQLRGGPPPFIQTTAAISHGSSGGGLFDSEARLVGFTTLYIDGGQSLNFAMPVEWLADIKPGSKPVAKVRGRTDWFARGIALEQSEDWEEFLEWAQQWTENDPKDASAWFFLGNAYYRLNRNTDVIDAYRQALHIDPGNDIVWYNLGIVYYELKRYTDAIDAYRKALFIDPENPSAWTNLGVAYANLNRYTDAIDAFRQALRIDPENANVWFGLGATYAHSGNRTAALEAVQTLRRLDPDKAEELFNLVIPR